MLSIKKLGCPTTVHIHVHYLRVRKLLHFQVLLPQNETLATPLANPQLIYMNLKGNETLK